MLKLSNLCTFLICDQGHCYFPSKFAVGNHLYFYCSPYLAENYFQVINNSTRSGLDTSQNMDLYFHLLTFSGGTLDYPLECALIFTYKRSTRSNLQVVQNEITWLLGDSFSSISLFTPDKVSSLSFSIFIFFARLI